jgi:hypothetical protein
VILLSRTWKDIVRDAFNDVTSRYDQIGRKTGGRTLSLVISPKAETLAVREWQSYIPSVQDRFAFQEINILDITVEETEKIGLDEVVNLLENPMIGEDPKKALGLRWENAAIKKMITICKEEHEKKLIIYVTKLSALYPATTPKNILQKLWKNIDQITVPVVLFLPGTEKEARTYLYLDKVKEYVYRGDII